METQKSNETLRGKAKTGRLEVTQGFKGKLRKMADVLDGMIRDTEQNTHRKDSRNLLLRIQQQEGACGGHSTYIEACLLF